MIDQQCLRCDFYDPDCECTCPSYDKWYACPIEAALPENQEELKNMAEWYSKDASRTKEQRLS